MKIWLEPYFKLKVQRLTVGIQTLNMWLGLLVVTEVVMRTKMNLKSAEVPSVIGVII